MFISSTLEEFVTMREILTPISVDHSLVFFSFSKEKDCLRGKGFWKFDISLTKNQNYILVSVLQIRLLLIAI